MSEPPVPFKAKALFAYESEYEDDLTFEAGQVITVTAIEDEEWLSGTYDGKSGMFPKNFVEVLKPAPPSNRPKKKEEKQLDSLQASERPEEPKVSVPKDQEQEQNREPKQNEEPERKESQPKEDPPSQQPSTSNITPHVSTASKDSKPPMPILTTPKVNDPYSVKKHFIATGKSSYVPKITPRDEYNIVGHAHHDVPKNAEVVKSTTYEQPEAEEPKVSLKERIALLQQRQQEEREREEAALRKLEERKQKQAEEKARLKELKEKDEQNNEGEDENGELVDASSTAPEESAENDQEDRHINQDDQEEDEDEDEDDDQEEDEEELKRKKLVERMAKISGGRNMFGMMGMAGPFGAPQPKHKQTKKVEESLPRESSSLAEDDDSTDEAESRFPEAGDVPVKPGNIKPFTPNPVNLRDVVSDSDYDQGAAEKISITGEVSKTEPAGYEADEDISDFKKKEEAAPEVATSQVSDRSAPVPESPTLPKVPPPVPESPTLPKVPPPVPESPTLPKVPPPVPESPTLPRVPPPVPESPTLPKVPPPVPEYPSLSPSTGNEAEARPPPPIPGSAPPRSVPPPIPQTHAPTSPDLQKPPVPSGVPPAVEEDQSESDIDETRIIQDDDYEVDNGEDALTERIHSGEVGGIDEREVAYAKPERSSTLPPIPIGGFEAAPPPPKRTSTEVSSYPVPIPTTNTGMSIGSGKRTSVDSTVSRSRSLKGKTGIERSKAEVALQELEYELGNISSTSNWWIRGELPESLVPKIGVDLIYEVETNVIKKRGSRTVNYRDYYILFYDMSQLTFELEYESEDPRSTIHFVNYFSKPIPIIRKDLLEKSHRSFGQTIASEAIELLGSTLHDNIVSVVMERIAKSSPNIAMVPPIGGKSFGVTIYKNFNNSNIAKIDEIRPGDILWIKNAKFVVHKGLVGSKTVALGENDSVTKDGSGSGYYVAIIYEFDVKKEKFKVIEINNSGHVRKESYKIEEMKSGRIRVFRAVGREYIGW